MRVNWKENKNLNPDVILAKIDSIKTVSEDKKVSYSGFDYQYAMTALVNMVDFPSHCDGFNHENIVSRAVSKIAKDSTLGKSKVMEAINNIVKAESATREHKYHMLTSLSLAEPYPFKRISLEGSLIRILDGDYPKKYSGRLEAISKHSNIANTPENYANVIVSLKNKSVKGAATKSLRVLDIVRSLWCLFGNSSMEIFGEQWKPINKIRLGSAHTIHKDNGNIASDSFWYEPNFSAEKIFKPKKAEIFSKNFTWALRKLSEIPYSTVLKDSLLRYVRALDERDQNVALIRLWGALEVLTAPSEANYDLVTRRCAFLFAEHNYHKQILEHLRDYRNSNVHSGDQSEQAKSNCYQLQFYYHHLVLFHLRNRGEFSSLDEANSFLDLPSKKETLENRKRLIEKAIKFVG
jgi:hypothetical protein